MNNSTLPLFPLPLVQFPGALTPLHIFEQRYRKLMKDLQETDDKLFGIICVAEESSGRAGRPLLGSVGCAAELAVVQELKDGRSNVLCIGAQRFRLLDYVEGEAYLQATVEYFGDDLCFDDLTSEVERATDLFTQTILAARLARGETRAKAEKELPELPDDATALSFIVASFLEMELPEKQALLELTDTAMRLRRVTRQLEVALKEYEQRLTNQEHADAHRRNGHHRNGHSKLPKL